MLSRFLRNRKRKSKFVSYLDSLFPKDKNKILLVVKDRTYFSGNLRVVLESFLNNTDKKLYIYKDGVCNQNIIKELEILGVVVLSGFSIRAVWHIVTSGLVILSHSPRDAHITKKIRSRKVVNLWHGAVFKKIEFLMDGIDPEKYSLMQNNSTLYDLIVASSKEDKKRIMKAFGVSSNKVSITGLPRYEILKDSYIASFYLKQQENVVKKLKGNRKLVLYAPTFRESSESPLKQITKDEWIKLNRFAEINEIVFGIRPHPYDKESINIKDNFYFFRHDDFPETNLLLKNVDILIVDYSSIWIDYLLLNRPIIGFAKDFQKYISNERAFSYDFKSIFPSTFTTTIEDLMMEIKKMLKEDVEINYEQTLKIYHEYNLNDNFREKIYTEIVKLDKK